MAEDAANVRVCSSGSMHYDYPMPPTPDHSAGGMKCSTLQRGNICELQD